MCVRKEWCVTSQVALLSPVQWAAYLPSQLPLARGRCGCEVGVSVCDMCVCHVDRWVREQPEDKNVDRERINGRNEGTKVRSACL